MSSLYILLAAILWGTTGTTQALAPASAHPVAIGAMRLAIGALFLLSMLLVTGKLDLKGWPVKPTILAAACMALYQPLFFSAVTITGVAIGTVVAIGSAPVLAGFIEWIYFKKRPAVFWWGSTALSITGCLLLFVNKGSVYVDPVGVVMALGAGLMFALYTLVSRELVDNHPSTAVVAVVFTSSAIMLAPLLFFFDMSWVMSKHGAFASLHLGIVATGIAYLLFAKGLTNVSSSTAVTLSLAEPLTAALLGVFIVGERLHAISWLGIILLLSGLAVLIAFDKKTDRQQEFTAAGRPTSL